jgi:hypothetical protein
MSLPGLKSRIVLVLAAVASVLSISAVSQGSLHHRFVDLQIPAAGDDLPAALALPPLTATVSEPAQVAGYPYGYGWYPRYGNYGCATPTPTLKTMQNYMWQSHQWRGDFPVGQPLYETNYGYFGTRWRRFPGSDCYGARPMPPDAFVMPAEPAAMK